MQVTLVFKVTFRDGVKGLGEGKVHFTENAFSESFVSTDVTFKAQYTCTCTYYLKRIFFGLMPLFLHFNTQTIHI
jgi:hypothetical protein